MKGTYTHRGFTLIELLVSVAIFTSVVVVSVSGLLVILDANRKAQNISSSVNNIFFSMETMTRLLRTGYDIRCATNTTDNNTTPQDCPNGGPRIIFVDDQNRRNSFTFVETAGFGKIERSIDADKNGSLETTYVVTSGDFDVERLIFDVSGSRPESSGGNQEQPTVTITLQGVANRGTPEAATTTVQSTVTQRILDL